MPRGEGREEEEREGKQEEYREGRGLREATLDDITKCEDIET